MNDKKIEKGMTVTLKMEGNQASNTFLVYEVLGNFCLLYHPICPDVYIIKEISELNKTVATLKDSNERGLDYIIRNEDKLHYNARKDLQALRLSFAIHRELTSKQKSIMSSLCGIIAAIYFNNDMDKASEYVIKNKGMLDDFNRMWYYRLKELMTGDKYVTGNKQRVSIFNIAGFVLAESDSPSTRGKK